MTIKRLVVGVMSLFSIVAFADSFATGSGVVVSSNQILTAYHVIDGASIINVTIPNIGKCKAHFLKGDREKDWAIVSVNQNLSNCAVMGEAEDVKLGDGVYVLGFPTAIVLGKSVKYAEGSVSACESPNGENHIFQISAPIQPGSSGGPLFNKKGQLIGIITSSISPEKYYSVTGGALPQNLNFAVNMLAYRDHINAALKRSEITVDDNVQVTCFFECIIKDVEIDNSKSKKSIEQIVDKDGSTLQIGEGITKIDSIFGYRLGDSIIRPTEKLCDLGWFYGDELASHDAIPRCNSDTICLARAKQSKEIFSIRRHIYFRTTLRSGDPDFHYIKGLAQKYVSLYEEKYNIRMKETVLNGDGGYMCLYNSKYRVIPLIEWTYEAKPNFYSDSTQDGVSSTLRIELNGACLIGYGKDFAFTVGVTLRCDTEESVRDRNAYIEAERRKKEAEHKAELDAI